MVTSFNKGNISVSNRSMPNILHTAAIGVLEAVIKCSDGLNFAQKIVSGALQGLVSDSVAEVREALAEQIACLGECLGREGAKEKLLPILKKLASDESPVARLNLCSKLAAVCKILGIDLFETDILPLLKEVTIDQRWRVRNSIVINIAPIGIQMGKDKFGKSRLKEILVQSLKTLLVLYVKQRPNRFRL